MIDITREELDKNIYEPSLALYNLIDDIVDKFKISRVTNVNIEYGNVDSKEFTVHIVGYGKYNEYIQANVELPYDQDSIKGSVHISKDGYEFDSRCFL